jgi:hypothetical protein
MDNRSQRPRHRAWHHGETARGIVFWRFMLADGPIETPRAEVVPFAAIGRR